MTILRNTTTLYLKVAILFMGVVAVSICVFGVPVVAREIEDFLELDYLKYLIIGIIYLAGLAFLGVPYQAIKLLILIDKNIAFSDLSVRVLKNIKNFTISIGFILGLLMPIVYLVAEKDDAPGLILIAMTIFVFAPSVVAVFAAVLQRLFQDAITIKSENELTV